MAEGRWGASPDQLDVGRPFKKLPPRLAKSYTKDVRNRGVPSKHRPLGQAALSECVADGLDVEPGELVLHIRISTELNQILD